MDIRPEIYLPVIYLAHSSADYAPNQMKSYFAKNYVNVMILANSLKEIGTKNIQGLMLMKVTNYKGTNMA